VVTNISPEPFLATWSPTAFERAAGLPAHWYEDAQVFALERERFFARSWMHVAHDSDIPSPSGWYRAEVAGFPILLTRDASGTVRGFHNVCPHRGAPLAAIGDPAATCGVARTVACPYHGWIFGLDGGLKGAPGMDAHPCFDKGAHAMQPLRLDHWGPFWFADLSGQAPPLADCLGPAVERFAGACTTRWKRVHRQDYLTASNWKFYVENNAEFYHEPVAHGTSYLSREVSWNNNNAAISAEVSDWCYMQYSPYGAGSPEMNGGMKPGTVMPGLADTWLRGSSIFQFWPNFAWILNPNLLVGYLIDPLGPTRTRIRWDWLVPDTPEALDRTNLDPLIELYDRVQKEDLAIFEQQQRCIGSPAFRMGALNPRSERGVHRFQELLLEHLSGRR
jgi:phenylpropionate dioxygenase-like ring-hydroxylating dioxygenase large terminal subunit